MNLSTKALGSAVPVGNQPWAIAITPDEATAYVANFNANAASTVTPIDLAKGTAGPGISVGNGPAAVAITPDQAPVASFTVTPGLAGSSTTFDASASTVAFGSIAQYAWSFGDGTTATSATATIAHTYAAAGSYTATLTETDTAGTSMAQVFTAQTISRNGGASARTSRLVSVGPAPQVLAALQAGAGAAGTSAAAGTDASLTHSTQHAGAGRLAPQPVTISAKRLTATRRGEIVIEVSCPLSARSGCRGTIAIRLAAPSSRRARAARCARGCRSLASANYEARAGQRLRVRAHMSSFGRRLLARRGRLRVTLTATSVTEGRTVQSTRTVTLSR